MDPRNRDWLRIIYEFGQKLQHLRLATITYGTPCAPYQALPILIKILLEFLARASADDSLVIAIIELFCESENSSRKPKDF